MPGNGISQIGVGKLSPALRKLVRQLANDSAGLANSIVAALVEGIADYSSVRNEETRSDIQASVRRNVDIWYGALLSGEPPDHDSLAALAEFGRHRVHQGVSLNGVLQAYRIGSRVIWEELLSAISGNDKLQREALLKVSPYILYHFDLLGQTIGQAYSREEQNLVRWRDRLRHDLCGVIFSTPEDLDSFRDLILALGLDDGAPHVALALRLAPSEIDDRTVQQRSESIIDALSQALDIERGQFLYYRRHDHLLAWMPLATGEAAIHGERRIADGSRRLAEKLADLPTGIGLPNTGPAGWRRSADQAIRAIDLGSRLAPRRQVFRFIDVALDDAVLGDDATARFLQGLIERLAVDSHLLETLEAYFDRRGYRKLIAADLSIHPNTLSYRLERIQTILDIELDDPNWQAALHTALRLRQLGHQTHS